MGMLKTAYMSTTMDDMANEKVYKTNAYQQGKLDLLNYLIQNIDEHIASDDSDIYFSYIDERTLIEMRDNMVLVKTRHT